MKDYQSPLTLARQLRYGAIALAVTAALLAGGLVATLSFKSLLQQAIALQQERGESAAREIDEYLNDVQSKLNYLARMRGFTELPRSAQQNLLEALARHNEAFESVALLDRQGNAIVTASLTRPVKLENQRQQPVFIRAFAHNEDYVGPVEIDPELKLPTVKLAVPVRNNSDRVDGVLTARINLSFLWVVLSHTRVGKTGYAYVIDNRLRLIAEARNSPETATVEDISERPFAIAHRSKFLSIGSEFLDRYRGLYGTEVLGTLAPTRNVPWKVITEQPTREVYAPARQMIVVVGGTLLAVTTLAGLASLLFSSQLIRPLNQLTEGATQIREGNFQVQVAVETRNELGALAAAFNQMAGQIEASFAALSASERRLADFLDAIPVGVFVIDSQGKPYYTNRTGQQLLGKGIVDSAPSEALAEVYQTYLSGTDELYPNDRLPIAMALQGVSTRAEDLEIRLRDRVIPIECLGTPIYDGAGGVKYAIATFTDITERRRAEQILENYNRTLEGQVTERTEELQQRNQELTLAFKELETARDELVQSEKMAALGQLVAGVAHEINTPLGAIQSSAGNMNKFLEQTFKQLPDLLRSLSPEVETLFFALLNRAQNQESSYSAREERKFRRALARDLEAENIDKADSFADALVDIGIYEDIEGFLPLFKEPNSPEIIELAYKLATLQRGLQIITLATARASKIVFALKTYAHDNPEGKRVLASLTEGIDTVLTLYHNQLKQGIEVVRHYTEIEPIWCYPDELNQVWTNLIHNAIQAMDYSGTLTIDISERDNFIQAVFIDSGKGIPPEILPRIFDPFFTTKAAGEGSGLGLDIVRKVVKKHQGEISVESQPGRTAIAILIPRNLSPEEPAKRNVTALN
ncbi:cache domain-containing protein [Oscillatoria sp. FACHB-1406]|uniref:cache domain-containing protein n=1 Tax=Oscillatoria sp. FACHB-1406 TaxID=2692846 RepID=UPI001688A987|nr:cache domain-containing protein [Oscillatoria sp. FACHB-1406]MBD2576837.1 HAMP domain-containing protein [Oscillatoria sp. FACHB-1406]